MAYFDTIARVAHEAVIAYNTSIGDLSEKAWEALSSAERIATVDAVLFIQLNPTQTAEAIHDAWYAKKRENGWALGPTLDARHSEHPAMVSYSQLPQEQRTRDAIFRAVVQAMSYDPGMYYNVASSVDTALKELQTLLHNPSESMVDDYWEQRMRQQHVLDSLQENE